MTFENIEATPIFFQRIDSKFKQKSCTYFNPRHLTTHPKIRKRQNTILFNSEAMSKHVHNIISGF